MPDRVKVLKRDARKHLPREALDQLFAIANGEQFVVPAVWESREDGGRGVLRKMRELVAQVNDAAVAAESGPERTDLADRLFAPDELEWDAEHVMEGGVLALIVVALLYLPIMIFNKATEKNHATISRWLARQRLVPRAHLPGLSAWAVAIR